MHASCLPRICFDVRLPLKKSAGLLFVMQSHKNSLNFVLQEFAQGLVLLADMLQQPVNEELVTAYDQQGGSSRNYFKYFC